MVILLRMFVVGSVLLAVTLPGLSQTSEMAFTFQPESKLWFEGTSTLHNFICEATVLEGIGKVVLEDGLPSLSSLVVKVPVKDLESGNESMNENMQEALNAEKYQYIVYEFTSSEVIEATPQTSKLKTVGVLTVSGKRKTIEMTVTANKKGASSIQFTGSTSLLMTDFGVEPPTMFLGTIKTGDAITVHFDVTVANKNTTDLR